jgi:hypothetical protein
MAQTIIQNGLSEDILNLIERVKKTSSLFEGKEVSHIQGGKIKTQVVKDYLLLLEPRLKAA